MSDINNVSIEINGKLYRGTYKVSKGSHPLITVSHPNYGSDTTQVGELPPELLAKQILMELVTKVEDINSKSANVNVHPENYEEPDSKTNQQTD